MFLSYHGVSVRSAQMCDNNDDDDQDNYYRLRSRDK